MRNVVDFGAFVDIGVHDDGLVHISQICNKFIRHPSEVLKIGDVVKVQVISVDVAKHRIGLTMKNIKEAEVVENKKTGTKITRISARDTKKKRR